MKTKQQLKKEITPILSKGKAINDLIFVSKKITILDVAFMLKILKPTKEESKLRPFSKFRKNQEYGWTAKQIYDMAENPVLTGGKDGLEQLVFACAAALEVYTEEEIMKIFEIQEAYGAAPNDS
jgi:hypothetical protein